MSRRASYCAVRTHVNRRPWLFMILGEILTFFGSFKVFHNLIINNRSCGSTTWKKPIVLTEFTYCSFTTWGVTNDGISYVMMTLDHAPDVYQTQCTPVGTPPYNLPQRSHVTQTKSGLRQCLVSIDDRKDELSRRKTIRYSLAQTSLATLLCTAKLYPLKYGFSSLPNFLKIPRNVIGVSTRSLDLIVTECSTVFC